LGEIEMGFPGSSILLAKVPKKWLAPRVRERIFMVRLFAAMSPQRGW
jgi:hypothetical protein